MNTSVLDDETMTTRFDDARVYEGVRTRRMLAFCIDYVIVCLLLVPFAILVVLLGILTLGLGWMLFGILGPAVWLFYVWSTLGGQKQATPGMRIMSFRLGRLDGTPIDGPTAVIHSVLFWAGNVLLTPLILLATFVLDRKQTVHDLLLGTVVTRSDR